jgi:hypothetical protein
LRSGLILVQVTLSLPLLIGAALFLSSLRNLRSVDPGFGKNNVLIASVNPALNGYPVEKSRIFLNDLLTGLRGTPGVEAASLATDSPIAGSWDMNTVVVEGYQPRPGERSKTARTAVSTLLRSQTFRWLSGETLTIRRLPGRLRSRSLMN